MSGSNGLDSIVNSTEELGSTDSRGEHGNRQDPFASSSSLPNYKQERMNLSDLLSAQMVFTAYARGRLQGIGAEQYDDEGEQRFEQYSITRTINELRDELADAVNYLTFIDVKIQRLAKSLNTLGALK